ncbi:CAP domain-containing protein [Nocardioides sp.]|uniref:CAP domain-containing protein n=1 Tax=Nocardioides sp. TaxID=35761 RepID=UPI00261F2C60|nr:CAP domain-containing protein [Nocardioides sp.]
MSKRIAALSTLLAVLIGSVGLVTPASAAPPTVTISAAATATTGTNVAVRGTVSKRASGLKVRLQTRSGGRWKTLATHRQGKRKAYAFTVSVRAGAHAYRVLTTATKKLRAARSRVVTLTGVTPPVAAGSEVDRARQQILADTNAYRAAAGLAPLVLKADLTTVAQNWATWMATNRSMVHNSQLGSQVPGAWRRIGENIGMGYSVDRITAAWYASPGHKANLLGDFTSIGIGFARDAKGQPWYVQDFAKY